MCLAIRKDEKCIAIKAKEWNPLISVGRLAGRPPVTWRKTIASRRSLVNVGMS